jgi:hypothetical protein
MPLIGPIELRRTREAGHLQPTDQQFRSGREAPCVLAIDCRSTVAGTRRGPRRILAEKGFYLSLATALSSCDGAVDDGAVDNSDEIGAPGRSSIGTARMDFLHSVTQRPGCSDDWRDEDGPDDDWLGAAPVVVARF